MGQAGSANAKHLETFSLSVVAAERASVRFPGFLTSMPCHPVINPLPAPGDITPSVRTSRREGRQVGWGKTGGKGVCVP